MFYEKERFLLDETFFLFCFFSSNVTFLFIVLWHKSTNLQVNVFQFRYIVQCEGKDVFAIFILEYIHKRRRRRKIYKASRRHQTIK